MGFGVRVLLRLGAVDRVGVGLFVLDRVGVAEGVRVGLGVGVGVVRRGVYDGLVGRIGVTEAWLGARSPTGAVEAIGLSWLVGLFDSVSRSTNHPTPSSRTRADIEAMSGPATPPPAGRLWFVLWFVTVSSLAQVTVFRRPDGAPFTNL